MLLLDTFTLFLPHRLEDLPIIFSTSTKRAFLKSTQPLYFCHTSFSVNPTIRDSFEINAPWLSAMQTQPSFSAIKGSLLKSPHSL